MSEVNRLEWEAFIKDSDLMAGINRIERRMGGMVENVGKKGRDMENVFAGMAKAATAFFTVNAAQNFIQQLVRVRSEFQQLEIAFTTMLGSKEKADKLTQDLIKFATTTPFGMKDTANAAKQLLAYGSSAESVKDELRMLGDVASGTSQPLGELVYLYGTLRTQGRAYAMDIRQFAGRGIPIYRELAKVLKVNEDQVNSFVESGKVGFAEVQKALQNMTSAGSMFGGLMEAQSKTIQGELERLGDSFDQMLNKIGKNTEGVISSVIQGASGLIENYEKILNIIGLLVATYGAYRAALVINTALYQVSAARAVGMTAAEMLHLGAITAKTAALKVLNAVMLASPAIVMTGSILALTAAIYSLTQVTDATSMAQQKLSEAQEAGVSKADQEKRSILQLVDVIKDNTISIEQRKGAYDKLQEQTGGILKSFSMEEIAIGNATLTLDNYIKKIREAASFIKAFDEFNALGDQLDELNRKGIDGVGVWTRTGRALRNAFGVDGLDAFKNFWKIGEQGKKGDQFIVTQEIDTIKKSMDSLKKEYGDKWNEIISGVSKDKPVQKFGIELKKDFSNFNQVFKSISNKGELESLKKQTQEAWDKLAPGDKQISVFESRMKKIEEIEKKYSLSKGGKTTSQLANTAFQEVERLISLQSDISKAKEESKNRFLSQDQQEIKSVKEKYNALRDEIRKFNADPRNKVKIDSSLIDGIEKEDLGNIAENQKNQKQLKIYREDLENYNRYLEIKKTSDEEVADNLLGKYKNVFSKIQSEIIALNAKKFTFGLSPIEENYLTELTEIQKNQLKNENNERQNSYLEALKLSETFSEAELRIRKKYSEALILLGKEVSNERKFALQQELAEEISAITSADIQKQVKWEETFSSLQVLSKTATDQVLDDIQKRLDAELNAGRLTREDYNKMSDQVNNAKFQNNMDKSWSASKSALDNYLVSLQKYGKDSFEAKRAQSEMFSALTRDLSSATGLLSDLSGLLGSLGASQGLQETIQKIGSLTDGISGIAQGIASGNPIAVVSGSIKAITAVIDLFNIKDKKIQKQIDKYQDQLTALESALDKIEKRIDDSVGESFYKDSDAAIQNLKNQQRLLQQMEQAESQKKKADKNKIQEFRNESNRINEEIAAIEKSVREMRVQTTVKELAQSLADSLVSAFESGGDAIKATDKVLDQFIKNALVNSLKLKYIEPIIKGLINDLDSYMAANGNSLEGFNFNKYREMINGSGEFVFQLMENLYSGLGLTKENIEKADTSISGKIKKEITEQTASELLGLYRAKYEVAKNQLSVQQAILANANQNLVVLNSIQLNTENTVIELKSAVVELKAINKNTGGITGRSAEGMGL